SREDRRQVSWLAGVGTGLPFLLTLAVLPWLPLDGLMGNANQRTSLCLVMGVAVIEDILLWAVLAVATALAKSGVTPKHQIVIHVATTLAYFAAGMTLLPRLLKKVGSAK